MSEQQSAEATETETEATEQQADEQPKPTETVEFWKQKAREQEKRAKENAAAAKRLAEFEESQKSEAEKMADRIKQLESEAAAAGRDALRFKVASKYGIGDEDADLFLTGSDEETLTKQAERLAARTAEQKKHGNRVPDEGRGPNPAKGSKGEAFAEFAEDFFTR
jgi:hypothetical protein